MLKAVSFTGGTGSEALMEAVTILKKLNADGARKAPEGAPTDFVPAKWAGYLEQAARDRSITAYRRFLGADGAAGPARRASATARWSSTRPPAGRPPWWRARTR